MRHDLERGVSSALDSHRVFGHSYAAWRADSALERNREPPPEVVLADTTKRTAAEPVRQSVQEGERKRMVRSMTVGLGCALLALNTGCLAVVGGAAVGGAIYHDAKKKQSREEFTASFRQTNLEREKSGLAPLDMCTEKYDFDRSWARQDPECRGRIDRYERGEHSALQRTGTTKGADDSGNQ